MLVLLAAAAAAKRSEVQLPLESRNGPPIPTRRLSTPPRQSREYLVKRKRCWPAGGIGKQQQQQQQTQAIIRVQYLSHPTVFRARHLQGFPQRRPAVEVMVTALDCLQVVVVVVYCRRRRRHSRPRCFRRIPLALSRARNERSAAAATTILFASQVLPARIVAPVARTAFFLFFALFRPGVAVHPSTCRKPALLLLPEGRLEEKLSYPLSTRIVTRQH